MSRLRFKRDYKHHSKKKDIPPEIQKKFDEANRPAYLIEDKPAQKKGFKKGYIPSENQRKKTSEAKKEYWRKVKEDEAAGIRKFPTWSRHGAFAFLKRNSVPENKRKLLDYANKERGHWIDEFGGENVLNYMEVSLINQAAKLLLYCLLIDDFLLANTDKSIVYTDKETNEIKMHTAFSSNYMSFTRMYTSILKELNKLCQNKGGSKNMKRGNDAASTLQNIMGK